MAKCPICDNDLCIVKQTQNSVLNSEQFDSIKCGDYYCSKCRDDDTKTGYKYFWEGQLKKPSIEEQLQHAINHPSLEVLIGSHLYGTANENSDEDFRGFCIPPKEYILGLYRFDIHRQNDPDREIRSVRKFVEELVKCNTQCLETLFAPQEFIIRIDRAGKYIIDNKDHFLHKELFKSFSGFARSEMRKVRGTKLMVEKRSFDEQRFIDKIKEDKNITGDDVNIIINILENSKKKVEVPYNGGLGAKRKSEFDKYGYCASNAYHAIRLLYEGIELLTTGSITFPRPEVDMLLKIRTGGILLQEIEEIYKELDHNICLAYEKSELPKNINFNKVSNILSDVYELRTI